MRFLLSIFTTVFICLTLTMCKHDLPPEPVDCGEATTIDEMMEWVYFKTGTYWIYEEQNSGALDTMTVYYDYSGVSATGNREFVMKMRSSLDGYTYEYWFNEAWSTESSLWKGCIIHAVDCDKYIPGDYVGGNHNFVFPLKLGNRAHQLGPNLVPGFTEITEHLDSLIVSQITYNNIYTFRVDFSIQHNRKLSFYRLAKNFGIVEKEIPEFNEHWLLIDNTINQ